MMPSQRAESAAKVQTVGESLIDRRLEIPKILQHSLMSD
jgi:hypothetical protein